VAIGHKVAGRKVKASRQVAGHKETGDHRGTGLHVPKAVGRKVTGHHARKVAGHKAIEDRSRVQAADRKAIGHHARKVAGHKVIGPRETGHSKTGEASLIRIDLSSKVINRSKVLIVSKIDSLSQSEEPRKEAGRHGTATTGRGVTVRRETGLQDKKGTSLLVSRVRHLHRRDEDYYHGRLPAIVYKSTKPTFGGLCNVRDI